MAACETTSRETPTRAEQVSARPGPPASTSSDLFQPVELSSVAPGALGLHTQSGAASADQCLDRTYLLAAALLGARPMDQAAGLLAGLDSVITHLPDRRQWRRRTEFLWALHALQTADLLGVVEHCRAADASVRSRPKQTTHPPAGAESESCLQGAIDAVVAVQLPLLAARAHIALGQPQQAEAILLERYDSREHAEASQPATMAMLACCQGRLADAMRLGTAALQAAERQDGAAELADLDVRLVLAEVFTEREQLDAASLQLHAARRRCWLTGATSYMWAVEIGLARVLLAQGRATEAVQRLEDLRVDGAGFLSRALAQKLNRLSIESHLALGDAEGALLIAKSNLPEDVPPATWARLDLCSGRPDRALVRLSRGAAPDPGVEIRRLVLVACAETQRGQTDRARDAIRRAVEAARAEGYVRPFLEHAAQILPLLRGLDEPSRDPYLSKLIRQTERSAPASPTRRDAPVLEPLTEREWQVLRHLPSHLTLGQIGLVLFLSTNTIKTHVKAIYRKIGAISRDDAVTIARSHGLLGSPP